MLLNLFARRLATSATIALSLCGASAFGDMLYAADNTTVSLFGVVFINPATMASTGTYQTLVPVNGLASNSETDFFLSVGSTVDHRGIGGNFIGGHTGFAADKFFDLSLSGSSLYAVDNTTVGVNGIVVLDTATMLVTNTLQTPGGPINGLAAGTANDAYISIGNSIFHYGIGGNLLGSYTGAGNDLFGDLFLRGNNLYAVDNNTTGLSGIVKFDAPSLGLQGAFLTSGPNHGLTGDTTNLYSSIDSSIYNLDTFGNVLGSHVGFNADKYFDLAYVPAAVPEPGSFLVIALGSVGFLLRRPKR